ncbi:MAG: NUDIX hydrolase [Candidatus Pacebacteria bacterium]|nr:NUDIX hydrolase [Candidatus Paceibacterota bacterium]PIR63956.1 MAG: DNA mismatch repair protein MutT [Candidatus Pacebacteria bacterium CG10_big_fil_rev_8_21_14_0_10_40_26]PIZ78655.1 MAG: DNA mismatch repair protein MutT [Candidatus Pacebacteria bacterium CG_4_10_14_0_2_um_filter_40_20]PJA68493.1 MAG: DNA mismatch repair protein MutT [Candidatus Pacebacteria bacterium CG_4_9_14_3_um_filter_40_12]PJC41878.1 MAG: DNA mismatch repair protein MutT [Candidatus Pacebacteria bacterium CG_4_9_14_0_
MFANNVCKIGIDCIGVGVGALISNEENKVFLALRSQKAKNERGKWEIPGGAVEFGETLEEALHREVMEEFGVTVSVIKRFNIVDNILPEEHQHWVAQTFLCRIVSGTPRNCELEKCDQIGWFSLEEAEQLPLALVTIDDIAILKSELQ